MVAKIANMMLSAGPSRGLISKGSSELFFAREIAIVPITTIPVPTISQHLTRSLFTIMLPMSTMTEPKAKMDVKMP